MVQQLGRKIWSRFTLLTLLIPLVIVPGSASAQTTVIVERPVVVPINTLALSDVDFLKATAPKLVFSIAMRTSDGSTVQARMSMTLNIFLASGESFPRALYVETRGTFTIAGSRTVTNIDLATSIPATSEFNEEAKNRLKEIALPSGTLPPGRYEFIVDVRSSEAAITQVDPQFEILITNPSSIDLSLPLQGEELSTPFPLFQWRSEGDARISIFEKLEAQGSLEDAASGIPMLTAVSGTQSYQYPSAGVRNLLPGKTYVWYVEGLAGTSGGTAVTYKSELRWFTISSDEGGAGTSSSALLDELERSLPPKYQPIIRTLREGEYVPQEGYRYNGRIITTAELLRLLNRLRMNMDAISNVSFE